MEGVVSFGPAAPARGTREWLLSVAGVALLCLIEAELELSDVVPPQLDLL